MYMNYKPVDGWAADFIPFFWKGEFHLFYLKDFRDIPGHGEGTPWCHLVTQDFIHFTDHGECLARGDADAQDLYVFTGSVINAHSGAEGFHIFYVGHNPHYRNYGRPQQAIMHAVSDDLYTWRKIPEDTFFAPTDVFEPHDWRDPYVFWNDEAEEYWMITAARLRDGPSRRRGCSALCTSKDLKTWKVRGPFYAPDLYFTHECPDLFKMGEWWYLIFSEFSESCVTRYRMARSLSGPWLTPRVDTFDGRAFYAAKTASDGQRRFLFGWNPTREENADFSTWQWGGNLVVHELVQQLDGTLGVCLPGSIASAFSKKFPVHFVSSFKTSISDNSKVRIDAPGSFRCASAGTIPETCLIEARIEFTETTKGFGIMLRTSDDFESGYYVRLEPQHSRLVFDSWPRDGGLPHMIEVERPVVLPHQYPIELSIYVNGSICEVYLNRKVALSTRLYDHSTGEWGVFVTDGCAEFSDISLSVLE